MSKLHELAGHVLRQTFPDLDDFEIAKLYKTSKCDDTFTVSTLLALCKQRITSINPQTNIVELIQITGKTLVTNKDRQVLDYTEYLKTLTLRKTSVILPKLRDEIIQLWTKEHWSFLDPYSDIEEAVSSVNTDTNDDHDSMTTNTV